MADLTPEDELGLLLELAETRFGIASPKDYEWYCAQPPLTSPVLDQLRKLEDDGYARMAPEWDEHAQRWWVYANITDAGRQRISALYAAGVEPSPNWSALSFDEEGLPPAPPE